MFVFGIRFEIWEPQQQFLICLFHQVISLFVFMMPSDSGEKITLGISAMLNMTVRTQIYDFDVTVRTKTEKQDVYI